MAVRPRKGVYQAVSSMDRLPFGRRTPPGEHKQCASGILPGWHAEDAGSDVSTARNRTHSVRDRTPDGQNEERILRERRVEAHAVRVAEAVVGLVVEGPHSGGVDGYSVASIMSS